MTNDISMKAVSMCVACALVAIAAGCGTITQPSEPVARPAGSVIGQPVADILLGYEGHRMQFFDPEGRALEGLPEQGTRGSVSIHNAEDTAQDNYAFDEKGNVVKHIRSAGDNYPDGKWEVVE